MRKLPAATFTRVVCVDGFAAEALAEFFQGGLLLAAEKEVAVAVADDGVGAILVERLQLALGLQHKAGGDLARAYRRHELLEVGYLPDVSALVYEAADMDGQSAAVDIVGFFAEQIEKLAVHHAYEEVKGAVRIAHDEKQRRFPVSQRVQTQLVIGRDLAQLGDVEGGEACAAAHEYAF